MKDCKCLGRECPDFVRCVFDVTFVCPIKPKVEG